MIIKLRKNNYREISEELIVKNTVKSTVTARYLFKK